MSDFMPWNSKKMSVGVQEIDLQHQELVAMLNNLYKEMKAANGGSVYSHTLAGLFNYASKHFEYEGSLMVKYQYPEIESHLLEHAMLLKDARKLEEKAFKSSLELLMFLRMWLTEHILQTDKEFGAFLNTEGVKNLVSPAETKPHLSI